MKIVCSLALIETLNLIEYKKRSISAAVFFLRLQRRSNFSVKERFSLTLNLYKKAVSYSCIKAQRCDSAKSQ